MENTRTVITPADAPDVAEDTSEALTQQATLESIRRAHLGAEGNIKAIGSFLLVIGILGCIGFLRSLTEVSRNPLILVDLLFLVANFSAALWLRNLDPDGRALYTIHVLAALVVTVLTMSPVLQPDAAAAALATNPVVLAIAVAFKVVLPGVFLLILWGRKARTVMSPYYRDKILPATPGIR